jgi:pyrroloquinoline quinone (PQQ) biosynthesis protein C
MAAHSLASHLTLKDLQTKDSNENGNNSQDFFGFPKKLWVYAASNWFLPKLCQVNKKEGIAKITFSLYLTMEQIKM